MFHRIAHHHRAPNININANEHEMCHRNAIIRQKVERSHLISVDFLRINFHFFFLFKQNIPAYKTSKWCTEERKEKRKGKIIIKKRENKFEVKICGNDILSYWKAIFSFSFSFSLFLKRHHGEFILFCNFHHSNFDVRFDLIRKEEANKKKIVNDCVQRTHII